jgi:hypothetical protein
MMSLTRGLQSLQKQVDVQTNVEIPSAALTLTRSATLAITTAGTTITWQTETRSQGFTWSGTDITIPTSGYYVLSVTYIANTAHTSIMRLLVGGVNVLNMAASGGSASRHGFEFMRYFTTGDVVSLSVLPSANVTVSVNAEGVASESPILHIVQLSGAV